MDEALVEQKNAKKRFGISIIKRRNKSAKEAYVVMTLEQWIDLYSFYQNNH
jgi:hypothetical protein